MYISMDRGDVAFSVKFLTRKLASPTRDDFLSMKRVFRYLSTRKTLVTRYDVSLKDMERIEMWADSDWAGDRATRKSTTGVLASFSSKGTLGLISRTQPTVSLSSAEAELQALCTAATEGIYIRNLISEVLNIKPCICLLTDSKAAHDAIIRGGTGRIRHVSMRILYLSDLLKSRFSSLSLMKIAGTENVADILTKHVSDKTLTELLKRLPWKIG